MPACACWSLLFHNAHFSWISRYTRVRFVQFNVVIVQPIIEVLEISNVHSERKIFAIFKLSRIWLLNYI